MYVGINFTDILIKNLFVTITGALSSFSCEGKAGG